MTGIGLAYPRTESLGLRSGTYLDRHRPIAPSTSFMPELTYVALGANLGEPKSTFHTATLMLIRPSIRVLRRARLYSSKPVGPQDQPNFVNSMLELETTDEPSDLLAILKKTEAQLGRTKSRRWGPRIIDLDIILYGERQLETPELTIPHREMTRRRFVLAPLADLCPNRVVPGTGQSVAELLSACAEDVDPLIVLENHIEMLDHERIR